MKTKTFGPWTFKIDRPVGTVKTWSQPDGGVKRFTYPCDYGMWPKLDGGDGEGLDAFVGDDPAGHLESFQKLKPGHDGKLVPDETKFLLGVTDAQREKIYALYGAEVNARRTYANMVEVGDALAKFPAKRRKSAEALPADLSHLVGQPSYYLARATDFRTRHPEARAPDYYADYGDKYHHRFVNELRPRLSPAGQAWTDATGRGLQEALERRRTRDPAAFDALERDPQALRAAAFADHPGVYLKSGLKHLPWRDKARIGMTPDVKDLLSREGLTQVARVLPKSAAYAYGYKYATSVFDLLNRVPTDYAASQFHTPAQIAAMARTRPALAGTQANLRRMNEER